MGFFCIVFYLSKKVKRILNIDSVTPKYLSIYDEDVYSSCIKQNSDIVIELLCGDSEDGITEFD